MANSENKLMSVINVIGEAILMNLAFLICCIPVVTIGQAWCGIYAAVAYRTRGEKWFTGFKKGFCTRFLRGTIAWTVLLAPIGYMAFQTYTVWFYQSQNFIMELVICGFGLLVSLGLQSALVLANAYLPSPVDVWLENGMKLTFTAPLHILCPVIITWLPVVLALFYPGILFLILLVFIAVYFALGALITTVVIKPKLIKMRHEMEFQEGEEQE